MYIIYIYTIYKSNTLHGIIRGQKWKILVQVVFNHHMHYEWSFVKKMV